MLRLRKLTRFLKDHLIFVEELIDDKVDIIINTTEGRKSINDSFGIRRTALMKSLPYFLTVSGARAAINSIKELRNNELEVNPITKFH